LWQILYLASKLKEMKTLLNLPVGRQYLADIREDNAIYVDKTAYIYDLCNHATASYFLARPRRFGKSLTLETYILNYPNREVKRAFGQFLLGAFTHTL
jgi:hypothetical protein